jgi:ABC-type Fe3+-siderophore transport system permease subunit
MLEIGIDIFDRVPKNSLMVVVISIVGAIVGHLISTLFKKRKKRYAIIFTIIFGLSTMYFPYIISRFDYYITLNISSFLMGVFFGIAVNLLE